MRDNRSHLKPNVLIDKLFNVAANSRVSGDNLSQV